MAAGIYDDCIIECGVDSTLTLRYKDNGAWVDVSGWDVQCHVRDAKNGDLLITGSVVISGTVTGLITITFPAEATVGLAEIPAYYDVKATPPGGRPAHLLRKSTAQLVAAQTR